MNSNSVSEGELYLWCEFSFGAERMCVCCSFAMLGAAGVVVPGLLTKVGILSVPDWFVAGEVAIKDSGIPLGALICAQTFLMGWAEAARYQVSLHDAAALIVPFRFMIC